MTLDLTQHFSRFRDAAPDTIHFAAHSHHWWPDVTYEAQLRTFDVAARWADLKWGPVFRDALPTVQRGIARILRLPNPETIAVAPNTHEFLMRILSALSAGRPPRILTSDSEFTSFSRQIARLEEENLVMVERIAAEPFETVTERFCAAAARGGHHLVFVSQLFFNSAAFGPDLDKLASVIPDPGTLLVIDGYQGFMAVPTDLSRIAHRAFYMAGGTKYAMAGEGCCFMHCPPGYAPRPRDTGWFAAFGQGVERPGRVAYPTSGARFMGATFDPSGLFRLAAVFTWMDAIGLTVPAIHQHVLTLQDRFLDLVEERRVDLLRGARLVTPALEAYDRGHFLAYEMVGAPMLQDRLLRAGMITDVCGDRLRVGFGCYHTLADLSPAIELLLEAGGP